MQYYMMSLHQCDGTVTDIQQSSTAFHDLDEARSAAIEHARAIMTNEISQGRLCLTCWIVIKNEDGHAVMTVPFGDAVEMLDHPACNAAPAPARASSAH